MFDRALKPISLRREGATAQKGERRVVGRDQSEPRAGLDREIAKRHAAFHRQGADRFARIFDRVAPHAVGADARNEAQREIFGRQAGAERAVDQRCAYASAASATASGSTGHALLPTRRCRRRKRRVPMRRRVAIAADDRQARQRQSLLRRDDMDDAGVDRRARLPGSRAPRILVEFLAEHSERFRRRRRRERARELERNGRQTRT